MNSQPSENHSASVIRHVGWKVWENPIFRRYCRSRLRPKDLSIWLLITLLVTGFTFAMVRSSAIYQASMSLQDAERTTIIPLLVIQGIILFIIGTAQVSGGMIAEKDEGVIDYQRLIPMTPLAKALGYLFGLPIREYVLFLATLPFTAWALWKGGVEFAAWAPLYAVFITATLTYHLMGLLTGTVVKNRRWAFLISISLIFMLYTVIPQLARFGLVFFEYLTITPVFEDTLPALLPSTARSVVETARNLTHDVKFFNLDFPEALFTVFCQGGLILIFLIIICRRWKRHESHLLDKVGALAFFIWIQILLLGSALPLVDGGTLFPSREISRRTIQFDWQPRSWEAGAMSAAYGISTLLFLLVLTAVITPSEDTQIRGWRRTRKHGGKSLPLLSDAATSYAWVLAMACAGAGGWYLFTRGVIESRWFPGQEVPMQVFYLFLLVMISAGMCAQTVLEGKGARQFWLCTIFVGVTPVMIGFVVSVIDDRLRPLAVWMIGMSPLSGPIYAAMSQLTLTDLGVNLIRSLPRAFYFWQGVHLLVGIWLSLRLRSTRKLIAADSGVHQHGDTAISTEESSSKS